PALSDGCEPGSRHGDDCQPRSARNPAAIRMASRNMGKPDFCLGSAMVAVVAAARLLRRGGASTAEAAVATGIAFASAIVIAFNRPPRGIDFQPLLAAH